MGATVLWVVPGYMGSVLTLFPNGVSLSAETQGIPVWGDLASFPALATIEKLALPSPLVAPAVIVPTGLAPTILGGYDQFVAWLRVNVPAGWVVQEYPYDWRLDAKTLGAKLGASLAASGDAGTTNYVLAHSYGALVAWGAWAYLVDAGKTAAVARLTTFAGALYGTSSTPSYLREEEDSISTLCMARAFFLRGAFGAGNDYLHGGPTDADIKVLTDLMSAWPSTYDLFPSAAMEDDAGDTFRPQLYQPSTWAYALSPILGTLAAASRDVIQPYIRQGKYVPPADKVNHAVCAFRQTPGRWAESTAARDPLGYAAIIRGAPLTRKQLRFLNLPGYVRTIQGDGRCTLAQQFFPGRYYQTVDAPHAGCQDDPAMRTLLVRLLTMDNPAPPAPPPTVTVVPWDPPPALPPEEQLALEFPFPNVTPPSVPVSGPGAPVRVGIDP